MFFYSVKISARVAAAGLSRNTNFPSLNKSLGRIVLLTNVLNYRTDTSFINYISSKLAEVRGDKDPGSGVISADIIVTHYAIILSNG